MPPQIPLTGAETLHPNDKVGEVPQIEYSAEAKTYINFRRQRMIAARDARDQPHEEFDNMTFLEYHAVCLRADNQYVAPRKNKQDTSINVGTVRDKDTSLVEYATKYDFEPVAQVFSEDDEMMEEMAGTGEDLVRKSLLIEMWKDKAKLVYRAMVAFGVAMVEDQHVERWTIEKTLGQGARIGSEGTTWDEKMVKVYDGCQAKLWDLRKCYFGDIRKFFMNGPQGQPYFFTVEYETYEVTKQIYGEWARWKYVPTSVQYTPEASSTITSYASWWTLRPITMNYCEIVRYYDPVMNEYAITINGIDMLPIMDKKTTLADGTEKTLVSGFPLTAISPSGAIPFAKYDLEPMHDFTYSKAQPMKMRVLADIENMWLKLLLGMAKQKAKPTMGNKSGRNFDDTVTDPGTVINDIREGDLFPVLPNYEGPSAQDFSFYELIKKELDKNSVERTFQGMDNPQPQDETATKEMNDMKAQGLKVAALFDGIISGNNQLFWLRTYNIAANWTKPVDVEVDTFQKQVKMKFRTVTMPSEIDGGQKATKKIVFSKTPPPGKTYDEMSQSVHQEELDTQKQKGGGEIRISYLHPDQFRQMRMNWFYTCVPVPNGSDPLSYMLFGKQIQDAMAFFGPESLNVKKLKHRFAALTGNDFDTWFISQQELEQKQQQMQAEASAQGAAGGPTTLQEGAPVPAKQPSIASAAKGAQPALKIGATMR